MKVALVHDWLTGMRGGEKCLEAFCELFPDAPIFTLIYVKGSVSSIIERHRIIPSDGDDSYDFNGILSTPLKS